MILVPHFAYCDETFKIAIVDIQTVLTRSTAMISLKLDMEKLTKELQQEFAENELALRKEEENILLIKDKITPEEYDGKTKDFNHKVTSVQKKINDKKLHIEQAYSEAVSEVNNVAFQIISELSNEKKFSVVFPSTQIVYANEALNITKEVTTRLNKQIAAVKLKL